MINGAFPTPVGSKKPSPCRRRENPESNLHPHQHQDHGHQYPVFHFVGWGTHFCQGKWGLMSVMLWVGVGAVCTEFAGTALKSDCLGLNHSPLHKCCVTADKFCNLCWPPFPCKEEYLRKFHHGVVGKVT